MSTQIICGACGVPAIKHGATDGIVFRGATPMDDITCYRMPEDIKHSTWVDAYGYEFSDYIRVDGGNGPVDLLHHDVSGAPALVEQMPRSNEGYWQETRFGVPQGDYQGDTYVDEQDYYDWTKEYDAVERWQDKALTADDDFICTPTLEQMQSGKMQGATEVVINPGKSVAPYSKQTDTTDRNAIVEKNDGFLSIQLLDDVLTRKHHAKLLNVYVDKQDYLRCGSVQFIRLHGKGIEGRTLAHCVKCKGEMSIDPRISTRAEMEQFTYRVIAHGNNHAAKWFTQRETFYALSPNLPEQSLTTSDEVVKFTKEHAKVCSDSRCWHDLILMQHGAYDDPDVKIEANGKALVEWLESVK